MGIHLQQLMSESLLLALTLIGLINLLQSLTLVSLFTPAGVILAGVGLLIGTGELSFYKVWAASLIGGLMGDWLSYCIGRIFKERLYQSALMVRYQSLLSKTAYALGHHSFITILGARFFGPTRAVTPTLVGMLGLKPWQFAIPSFVGSMTWPLLYIIPGILAGIAIDFPSEEHKGGFFILFVMMLFFVSLAVASTWYLRRYYHSGKTCLMLNKQWHLILCVMAWIAVMIVGYLVWQQPLLAVYYQLLYQVLFSI